MQTLDYLKHDVQLYIQSFTSVIAVGLSGPNVTKIEHQYYSLYNLKGTNSNLIWLQDTGPIFFAYVWSSWERFNKWLKSSSCRLYYNNLKSNARFSCRESINTIKSIILERKNRIINEKFLPDTTSNFCYKVSQINLEKLDKETPRFLFDPSGITLQRQNISV